MTDHFQRRPNAEYRAMRLEVELEIGFSFPDEESDPDPDSPVISVKSLMGLFNTIVQSLKSETDTGATSLSLALSSIQAAIAQQTIEAQQQLRIQQGKPPSEDLQRIYHEFRAAEQRIIGLVEGDQ